MSLTKVNYIDNSTIITAQNLNDIQDNIIQNAELIKKVAPRNLLDNSDFTNPVNQRGFVSGTGGQANYTIDRWWLQHVTNLHLYSDCIGLSGFWDVTQWIGSKITTGTTLTFAVMAKSEAPTGNVFVSINNTTDSHGREIRDSINNIEWKTIVGHWTADRDYDIGEVKFKLGINTGNELTTQIYYKCPVVYEGEYTIDTLPEYQPKGYENELLICKQYSPETGKYIGIPEVVNNFTTTEEGFVADARALKVLNDSMPSTELLWENASPTSQFAKQTISLDLNGYNAVIIHASSCSLYVPLTALNQTSEVHSSLNYARVWNASGVWMIDFQVRDIKITRESISFGVGGYRAFHSSAPTDPTHDNTFQIPLYIYGIK